MLTSDKKQLQSRFTFNECAKAENFSCKIDMAQKDNLFSYILINETPELVNDYQEQKWRNMLNKEITDFLADGAICLAPIAINNRMIGVITGQKLNKKPQISCEDFSQFCFLIEHLNMCLSIISKK